MTCVACTGSSLPGTTFCGQCGQRVSAPVIDHLIGSTLDGRYVVEAKIAAGGFGTVYRGRSLATGERVALKVLLAQHSNDPSVSARFRREAVAMSSLANRHTVTTYELGEDAATGAQFIAMELLDGESLYDRFIACGTLHWRTALAIVRQVCESLAEAHGLGIVHRDLKPANIFLTQQPAPDFVKVLDFGIAKILQDSNMHDGADLTRIGQAIGTLEYMSPEQLIGGELDNRTDIYTLGVVAYEMIVGRRPFGDTTGATGLVTALMTRRPPLPSQLARGPLPAALDGVLLRCLERDPQDRYADVRELARAIDLMLATKDDLASTQRRWLAPVVDQEDELTLVDSRPPVDEPRYAFAGPAGGVGAARQVGFVARVPSRPWRAQGTPFDVTDSRSSQTGAQPLVTDWAIGTEATAPVPRLAIGSSPKIEHELVPELPRLRPGRLVAWAVGLLAAGLGIGAALATLAG